MYKPSDRRRRSDAITPDDSIPVKFLGVKIDGTTADGLDELAARRGIKRSMLVREVLRDYLAEEQTASA